MDLQSCELTFAYVTCTDQLPAVHTVSAKCAFTLYIESFVYDRLLFT